VPNGALPTRSGGTVAIAVAPNPSAANAVPFELVTVKLAALSACSAMTPPLTLEGVELPVIESILLSRVCTLSVTLS